jgi:hypothetical protein
VKNLRKLLFRAMLARTIITVLMFSSWIEARSR